MINELLNGVPERKSKKIQEELQRQYGIEVEIPDSLKGLYELESKILKDRKELMFENKFNNYHKDSRYNALTLLLDLVGCEIEIREK